MYQINNKGDWAALKEKIRQTYPDITDADLELNNKGDEGDLLIRLQKKLGKSKKEIIVIIDQL